MIALRLWLMVTGLLSLVAGSADGRVIDLQINSRAVFAGGKLFGPAGAYEIIRGRLFYGINPSLSVNRDIVDVHLAETGDDGIVNFDGEFVLLKPVETKRGNRGLFLEVTNRGNLILLPYFNLAAFNNQPETIADAGDGFLLEKGYSLLWTAWNWDVLPGGGRLQMELPLARKNGQPIKGRVIAEIVARYPTHSLPITWGQSRGYPASRSDVASALLTIRPVQNAKRRLMDRAEWEFATVLNGAKQPSRRHLYLVDGFKTGAIYELNYVAEGARIVGLGLAALRDAASFFRYEKSPANPLSGSVNRVFAFGHSQSARVLQHMLWQGFHLDESERILFDGIFMNAPGGGKGSFNHRFAQTTRHPSQHEDHQYPADFFPFATVPQTDPVSGRNGDLLARVRQGAVFPKLFYTQTSTDYWTRSASLLHTDVMGKTDLPLDPHARLYVFAGAQHFIWVPPTRGRFVSCHNPSDYRYILRALLGHLDSWVTDGRSPPSSVLPTISGGTLGDIDDYRRDFPSMPGVAGKLQPPKSHLRPPRMDFGPRFAKTGIIEIHPPRFGRPFETLLPRPDRDGIDRGGIRLPQLAAPLGSYLGWNHRRDGARNAVGRWSGSYAPFAKDPASARPDDKRLSVAQRYRNLVHYLAEVEEAARKLTAKGFLLPRDVPAILTKAKRLYLAQAGRTPSDPACGYLRH